MKQIASWYRTLATLMVALLVVMIGFVGVALAQEVVAPVVAESGGGAGWKSALLGVGMVLLATLLGVIQRVGTKFINKFGDLGEKWLADKIQSEGLENAVLIVHRNAMTVAADVWQTEVSYLKTALKDGRLTKEERIEIRRIALDKFNALTPDRILQDLRANGVNTATLISSALEEAVTKLKLAKKTAKNGDSPKVPKAS